MFGRLIGQPYLSDFERPIGGDKDVMRFEVAVDHTKSMDGCDGPGERFARPGRILGRHTSRTPLMQRLGALRPFRGDEREIVPSPAAVDCEQVWMLEAVQPAS